MRNFPSRQTFTAEGPQRTRVALERRNLECFGEAAQAMRDSLNRGWGGIMALYAKVATG
jgi:hypothetical protein